MYIITRARIVGRLACHRDGERLLREYDTHFCGPEGPVERLTFYDHLDAREDFQAFGLPQWLADECGQWETEQ